MKKSSIKPLNAPRIVHVRTDSRGNPIAVQVPPAIDSPRARRASRRRNPHPNLLPTRERGQSSRHVSSPPSLQGRELEGGSSSPNRRSNHPHPRKSHSVSQSTTANARTLRKNPTPAENLLWKHLRKTQIPKYKFTRQYPVGPYIVDFCCRASRLVVELDGGHHAVRQEEDISRQQDLEDHGYRVIRFWNNEVFNNIEGVLFRIVEELERLDTAANRYRDPHPNPLPTRERGQSSRHISNPPSLQGRELEGGSSSPNKRNSQLPLDRSTPALKPNTTLLTDGKWMRVVEIENLWKVNDEWWRGPDEEIARLYYVLRLGSGQQLTVYLDLTTNDWYRQAG